MLPIDESKSDSKKNPVASTTSSLSSSPPQPSTSSVSTSSTKKAVTMDEKSITNNQSNITAKSPHPHSNVAVDTTTTSPSPSIASKPKSNKHKKRSASFQTGNVYLNLQKESSEQTFPPPSMMNPMDKKTSIINYIPGTDPTAAAATPSQINPQQQAHQQQHQVPVVPPPSSVPHHQHHHHQVNFQPVPTFYDPNNSTNFNQPQGASLPQSAVPPPPSQVPSVPVSIPPRPTSPPMVSSFSFEQQRPPMPLPPQPATSGSGHSNPMVSFQMEPSQEEPHSLPPPQLPPPSPPLSSSSTTTRTLSASDPDLYYMSLPPVKMPQTTVTPLLNVDNIQPTIHEQSQQIPQQQDEQQKQRQPSFQRERANNDRSIRFDQQASANPTNATNTTNQSMRSSKSMKVLPGHRRQTPPHHQSTFQNITLQDGQKQSQSRQRMAQSRRSLASPRHSQMSHAKSTNLSNMRLSYPYSDPDISDIEINNNYIDNNNASDDSEAMAILPIEARDLLMQEEEERKSRLAKESTSLLRVPGYGARRESKYFPGRIRKRVILKNGNINLCPEHVDKRSQRYLQDTFTTMVDIRWRWNLLVFAMGFIMSWFAFSIIWWLIAFSHSDFEHLHDEEWTPCVANMRNFASAFLFSIETQHTIGYGSRYTTEECPEALFVMCLQSITGVMIQCFMVGFVFAKLSRPQKRSQTLMFSRYAIVNSRDSKLCLMFRVGDLRDRSHIIGCTITAQIIRKKITEEGELIPYFHQKLDVKFDEIDDEVFLIWPAIIVHVIDKKSPFYTMNADDMMREKFEIIAILEGTVESTGQTVQARTSYLPSEILWGHRFEQLIRYRHDTGEYLVDYSKFNNTFEVDVPFCSAKELEEELKARRQEQQQQNEDDEDRTQSEEE